MRAVKINPLNCFPWCITSKWEDVFNRTIRSGWEGGAAKNVGYPASFVEFEVDRPGVGWFLQGILPGGYA